MKVEKRRVRRAVTRVFLELDVETALALRQAIAHLPSCDPTDPLYKLLVELDLDDDE